MERLRYLASVATLVLLPATLGAQSLEQRVAAVHDPECGRRELHLGQLARDRDGVTAPGN